MYLTIASNSYTVDIHAITILCPPRRSIIASKFGDLVPIFRLLAKGNLLVSELSNAKIADVCP